MRSALADSVPSAETVSIRRAPSHVIFASVPPTSRRVKLSVAVDRRPSLREPPVPCCGCIDVDVTATLTLCP